MDKIKAVAATVLEQCKSYMQEQYNKGVDHLRDNCYSFYVVARIAAVYENILSGDYDAFRDDAEVDIVITASEQEDWLPALLDDILQNGGLGDDAELRAVVEIIYDFAEKRCTMTLNEFFEYLTKNFNIDAVSTRLIHNILEYASANEFSGDELTEYLNDTLGDVGLGIDEKELKLVVH